MSTIWKALVVLCIVGLVIVGYVEYKLYTNAQELYANTKALHAWVQDDFWPKFHGGPGEGAPPPPPPPNWK